MKDSLTGRSLFFQNIINLFPKKIRLILNPNRGCIESFMRHAANNLKKGSLVLDAGAGPCPYKSLFSHCAYQATDFKNIDGKIDFTCSLEKIPKESGIYDAVISTEVLEHVEYPQKVISEFYRILKKKGKLFMTVPQSWKLHQEPHNYYYFTKYGLQSLLKNAGFKKFQIAPKGGFFWFLSDAIRFSNILEQYKNRFLYWIFRPTTFIFADILLPLVLFPLDSLDKEKKWTLGYLVEAEK